MTHANSEAQRVPRDPDYHAAYLAGNQAVLGMPRWKFLLLLVVAVAIGEVVEKWLVASHLLSGFKASLLSFVAVMLFGLLAGLAIRRKRNNTL